MDKKYYTPSVEEFHIGFEYEIRDWWTNEGCMGFTANPTPNEIEKAKSHVRIPDGFTKRILKKEMLWEWRIKNKEELAELQKTSTGNVGNPGADYRHEWERITTGIEDGSVRVKYLDREDIESLGFEWVQDDGKSSNDYILYNSKHFLHLNAIKFTEYSLVGIEVSVDRCSTRSIVISTSRIRNKSELYKLLQMCWGKTI